jgi:hypothetical protein
VPTLLGGLTGLGTLNMSFKINGIQLADGRNHEPQSGRTEEPTVGCRFSSIPDRPNLAQPALHTEPNESGNPNRSDAGFSQAESSQKTGDGVADLERAHLEGIAGEDRARYFSVSIFMRFVS